MPMPKGWRRVPYAFTAVRTFAGIRWQCNASHCHRRFEPYVSQCTCGQAFLRRLPPRRTRSRRRLLTGDDRIARRHRLTYNLLMTALDDMSALQRKIDRLRVRLSRLEAVARIPEDQRKAIAAKALATRRSGKGQRAIAALPHDDA